MLNTRLLRDPPVTNSLTSQVSDTPTGARPQISVLVPARNEAARIGPCIFALLDSRGVDLELVVLDDNSTDDTTEVVAAAAAGDPRLRMLHGGEPPPGWLGKPHACARLADHARGRILAFVDADVLMTPDGLARSVALLNSGVLDMVCPYPRQVVDSIPTRLIQPLLQWSWLTFLPLRLAERSPRPSLVAANGQLMVCRTADYHRVGGHRRVRDAVLEDLELARAFKRAGLRAGIVAGHEIATCTMYRGWRELRAGYTKSLWVAFGSPAGAAAVIALLVALYVLPPLAMVRAWLRGDSAQTRLRMLATAGGVAGRVVTARRTGGVATDAIGHPLSILGLGWLTVASFRARARGTLDWRGRRLPGRGRG